MATAYSTLMGLAEPVQGELSGTWGDTVNKGITEYLDVALAGTQTISGTQTAVTLSLTNGNASATNIAQAGSGATGSAQFAVINCTGAPVSLLTITVPASSRQYIVINATSTSQSVKVVGVGPTTGVTIVSGEKAHIAWNGSDFVKVASTVITNLTGTLGVANGGTGLTSGTSGGVLAFTASGTLASSTALAANALVIGGGAGVAPSTTTTGTGVVTAIGNNTNSASGLAVLNASGYLAIAQGGTNSNATATAGGVGYGTGTAHAYTAAGTAGQVLQSNGASAPTWVNAATGDVTAAGNNAFTGANTFYNATGQTFSPATANDGIIVKGRAGGTSSYRVTLTPTTLTASRTLTFPDADTTIPVATQVITFSGPTAARTYTLPDSASTLAALATAQTFTALQTFSGSTSVAAAKLANAKEVCTISATAATGTIAYDVTTQSVLYYTSNASANWTVNFRGSSGTSLDTLMSTGESMTVAFLVTQGSTAYYNSAVQVDGASVTPKYQGGTAWTAGNASSIDAYVYTIVKTGSATFTVFASQTQFK